MESTTDANRASQDNLDAQMVATFIAANYNRQADVIARHAQQAIPDLRAILSDEARMRALDKQVNQTLKDINPTYVKEAQAIVAEALDRGDARERAHMAAQAQAETDRAISLYRHNPQQQSADAKMVTDFIAANHDLRADKVAANALTAAPELRAILADEGKMAMLDAPVRANLKGLDPLQVKEAQATIASALGRGDAGELAANLRTARVAQDFESQPAMGNVPSSETTRSPGSAEQASRQPLLIDGLPVTQVRYSVTLDEALPIPTLQAADVRLFKGRKVIAAYANLTRGELEGLIGPANTANIESRAGQIERGSTTGPITGKLERNELASIGTTAKGLETKLLVVTESTKDETKATDTDSPPPGRVSAQREFAYEALSRVAAARRSDRARFEQALYLNTIEPTPESEIKRANADAARSANAAPAASADKGNSTPRASADNAVESDEIFTARKPDNRAIIPPEVEKQYIHVGSKFYHRKRTDYVAFEDKGNRLETASNSESIAESMVRIAEARGWDEIKVAGSETFRREAWLEAASRGMHVKGYSPSEVDKAILAQRGRTNRIENASASQRQAEQEPMPGGGKSENTVAADAKREAHHLPHRHDQRPQPTHDSAVDIGEMLIAHGPANYMHDKDNSPSYYVTTTDATGTTHTTWGIDLGRAIKESQAKVGDKVTLRHEGQRQVLVPVPIRDDSGKVIGSEEKEVNRNTWGVTVAEAFIKESPEAATSKHPELATAFAALAAIDKQGEADGLDEKQRAIVATRVRGNLVRSLERGAPPAIKIMEQVPVTHQQDASQELSR